MNGIFDGGFGQDGVLENAVTSQRRGANIVCTLPALINDTSLYKYFGNLLDAIQKIADNNIRDGGK